jgi:hypothetical protein
LREILLSCNRRYLEYLSSLDDFSAGIRALDRLTQPQSESPDDTIISASEYWNCEGSLDSDQSYEDSL